MRVRLHALRSLHLNYKWKGVYIWLKGRKRCWDCVGKGVIPGVDRYIACPTCHGKPKRGYQRVLSEPERVLAEQEAIGGLTWNGLAYLLERLEAK